MEEKIEYFPNKAHKTGAILFSLILLLPMSTVAILFFRSKEWIGFRYMMSPILVVSFMIMISLALSKLKIIFTKEAIYIQYNRKCKVREYRYDDYMFAYYCKSAKGQWFLILSQCELQRKRVKRIAFWVGGVGATFYDSCVVIFLDGYNKQIDNIKKNIAENVKNVYEVA